MVARRGARRRPVAAGGQIAVEIGALPRTQALQALGRQQQRALSQGDTALVDGLYRDLVTLQRARGSTVGGMAQRADRRSQRFEWFSGGGPVAALGGAGLLGGAVAGVALAQATPLWSALFDGAWMGGLAGAMVGALVTYSAVDMSDPGRPVREALERCDGLLQAELRHPTPEVARTEILAQLDRDAARQDLYTARQTRQGARYLKRHPDLGLGQLYCWARTRQNQPTIASLEAVLAQQPLRQLITSDGGPTELEWTLDELRVGDQSLFIDQA